MFGVHIQAETIEMEEQAVLSSNTAGAELRFVGKVRNTPDGTLTHLVLEHFPGVTEREITRILEQARQRWSLHGARVVHRVGRIAVGEDIVAVHTSSAHRRDAYEANAFIMDYLKTEAPFWKQECFADGAARWVQARESDQAAAQRWQTASERKEASVLTDPGASNAPIQCSAGPRIGALVLAGGEGRRMGYGNKGLQTLAGQTLVQHVCERLRPQVAYMAISANHDLSSYRALGYPVFSDAPGYLGIGPLAGIASSLPHFPANLDAILIAPCDTPFLPHDLLARLRAALFDWPSGEPNPPAVAMAATGSGPHPSVLLLRPGALLSLVLHLQTPSKYSILGWLQHCGHTSVYFDDEDAFANVNDRATLAHLGGATAPTNTLTESNSA